MKAEFIVVTEEEEYHPFSTYLRAYDFMCRLKDRGVPFTFFTRMRGLEP